VGQDAQARLWEVDTGKQVHSFEHDVWVGRVAISPGGKRALTVDLNGGIYLWQLPK
jgi:WD40 repeat protein